MNTKQRESFAEFLQLFHFFEEKVYFACRKRKKETKTQLQVWRMQKLIL
jgi:hypothetical protein